MIATALIAEDEPVLAHALSTQLGRLWPELRLLPLAQDGDQAVAIAVAEQPDVLFLDIKMPGRDGLDAAEAIADAWPEQRPLPLTVFVTAYDEYALAAFEQAAVDYVLKPVQATRLAGTCERLQQQLRLRAAQQDDPAQPPLQALRHAPPPAAAGQPPLSIIQVSTAQGLVMVPVDDVLYFEAADKYVRLITVNSGQGPELLIRTPLRELMPRLDTERFWQVHRSAVVNVRAIERVSRDARANNRLRVHLRGRTETLEVSRMYAHLFKAM
jgi:DNA-binding LytR/AlgR family response regulator